MPRENMLAERSLSFVPDFEWDQFDPSFQKNGAKDTYYVMERSEYRMLSRAEKGQTKGPDTEQVATAAYEHGAVGKPWSAKVDGALLGDPWGKDLELKADTSEDLCDGIAVVLVQARTRNRELQQRHQQEQVRSAEELGLLRDEDERSPAPGGPDPGLQRKIRGLMRQRGDIRGNTEETGRGAGKGMPFPEERGDKPPPSREEIRRRVEEAAERDALTVEGPALLRTR